MLHGPHLESAAPLAGARSGPPQLRGLRCGEGILLLLAGAGDGPESRFLPLPLPRYPAELVLVADAFDPRPRRLRGSSRPRRPVVRRFRSGQELPGLRVRASWMDLDHG